MRVTQSSGVSSGLRTVRVFFRAGAEAEAGTAVGVERVGRRRVWEEGRERREGVVGMEAEG